MPQSPIQPKKFASRLADWLASQGPEADVVISCRVRLARNVEGYPFVSKLSSERALELASKLRPVLAADGRQWVDIQEATPVLRLLLRERHLVSRDLAPSGDNRRVLPGRAVAFDPDESISVMVNEEDHLRLQVDASRASTSTAPGSARAPSTRSSSAPWPSRTTSSTAT